MVYDRVQLGDMLEELPGLGEFADCLVTDPPYRTITGGQGNGANSVRPSGILESHQDFFPDMPPPELWMPVVYGALKPDSHAYIFSNVLCMEEMLSAARQAGFRLHNILVWVKNNCTPSQYYMKNCEYVLFLRKGRAHYINDIGGSRTAYYCNNITGGKRHPTEKPVELLRYYIGNSTRPGDVVLDPFAGCGSTCEAAVSIGRRFVGYEINPDYCPRYDTPECGGGGHENSD